MKIKPINVSIIAKKNDKIRLIENNTAYLLNRVADAEELIARSQKALETGELPVYYASFPEDDAWDCVRKDIADYTEFVAKWKNEIKDNETVIKKYCVKVGKYILMVAEAIDSVQSKCRVRKITTDDVIKAIRDIENHLRLPIKKMNGVHAWINPNHQTFKRAYNGIPESTQFGLIYKNGSWYMDRICRKLCTNQYMHCALTDEAKRYLIERIENGK